MMQKMRKLIVVFLVISLLGSSVGVIPAMAAGSGSLDGDWTYNEDNQSNLGIYENYLKEHENAVYPSQEIAVDVSQFQLVESEFAEEPSGTKVYDKYENIEGSENVTYIGAKSEKLTFTFEVPETGLYSLEMNYYPLAVSSVQYQFSLLIDGETPFVESNSCRLDRVWQNEPIVSDEEGNDLRPAPVQKPEWRKQFLYDQNGVYGNLKFYLEKGTRTITFIFDGTPLLLKGLTFKQDSYQVSYQDYITMYQQMGTKEVQDVFKPIQAESYYRQSSASLWPDADRTSPLTEPYSYKSVKLNYGGGSQWKEPGQWISWEIDAPESGFYHIGCKYKQGYLDGLFSSRKIYIDGEVPFEELNAVRFNYTSSWKNMLLGDDNGAYYIYLEKGTHIITMENVIGDLSETIGVMQTVMGNLNDLYLSVVMITGSSPDPYRDYFLTKQLPDLPEKLRANADILFAEAKRLETIVGHKGAENAYFEDLAYNLQSYAENIEDLTYKSRLTNLKNDMNGMSSKLAVYREQALDLDYIALVSANMEMPKTNLNAWEWIVFQVRSFFASFKGKAKVENETRSVRVWVSGGIDQYEILKNIINDEFTPKYGIEVDLELAGAALVNAIAAGTGPDVLLGQNSSMVVNLGLRGALEDLSQYPGYFDILKEYVPGSEIPFVLEGRYYAVPSTNTCQVMFVRTDIFENMGLEIPQTWDDIYDVAQVLQRYNMNLGCAGTFSNLLYQKGGSYFNEELTEVCFDSDIAVEALIQHAEFYTKYGFPKTYDFANRFRTGEMPIAIAEFSAYTTLKYTAPEISGLWQMYPIPGTLKEDGTIDRTQMDQSGVGAIMLSSAKDKDACWELIQWWSKAETQARYGNDLEAALGIAARRPTANLVALKELGWTAQERALLEEQFEWLQFIPIVPGNYYVTRGMTNFTRGVIDHGENARELLTEWTIKINDEITRKREEFFLNN